MNFTVLELTVRRPWYNRTEFKVSALIATLFRQSTCLPKRILREYAKHELVDGRADGQTSGWADKRMGRWTRTDGRVEGRTDGARLDGLFLK